MSRRMNLLKERIKNLKKAKSRENICATCSLINDELRGFIDQCKFISFNNFILDKND